MVTLLGAAAYRVLPAAKNMFAYMVNIRYYAATVVLLRLSVVVTTPWIEDAARGTTLITGLSWYCPELPARTMDLQASKSSTTSASCPGQ